ncbi:MAG: ABC-F family ATP-binding cassette domain-containing protein, partial [Anaerolineales bacterium]|nr:ABC-F family ATP-binding cassette domain-containing protein [Anaerolineales bacterium]
PNGIGKTTLLRLLANLESPDGGRVHRTKRMTFGYLPQEVKAWDRGQPLDQSLWEAAMEAFAELREIEAELQELENAMAEPRRAAQAMAKYGPLQEQFERAGGYSYPAETERVLRGLGFNKDDFTRPLRELSGGERTRALLARLLLEDPDLLILDEPTNHLDLEAIEWLEEWLDKWPGAALIVSHDRYFLDRTVENVWELTARGLETYSGNYSAYVEQREMRRARRADIHAKQQKHIAKEREYIRRNIAGQNTRQAQGRRKRLKRFLEEEAVSAPEQRRKVSLAFEADDRAGELVLRCEGLQIGRGGESYFTVPDLLVRRGDRVAIIGPNGAGKTTLLKTVVGDISPIAGSVELGANVQPGYFAQAHEGLEPEHSVLESLLAADESLKISEARSLLGRYLFRGDDVEKSVASLSGGERGRLALARLAQQGANLLLLDEPTTHLDLASQEILEAALTEFPGTILFISHDRYLIDSLATHIWAVGPDRPELDVFRGGYEAWREAQRVRESEPQDEATAGREKGSTSIPRTGPSRARRMQRLEDEIEDLEEKLEALATDIETAGGNLARVRTLGEEYAQLERTLRAKLTEWERLAQAEESA